MPPTDPSRIGGSPTQVCGFSAGLPGSARRAVQRNRLDLLGPLGWNVTRRYPTHSGTEEVVYIGTGDAYAVAGNAGPDAGGLALRPADGGAHRYNGVGVEHIAFEVDTRAEVEEAHAGRVG